MRISRRLTAMTKYMSSLADYPNTEPLSWTWAINNNKPLLYGDSESDVGAAAQPAGSEQDTASE